MRLDTDYSHQSIFFSFLLFFYTAFVIKSTLAYILSINIIQKHITGLIDEYV